MSSVPLGIIVLYLLLVLWLGYRARRKDRSASAFFEADRKLPWYLAGVALLTSQMSSLTYLSEPGEVWLSGVTNFFGKIAANLFEMLFIAAFILPFWMRHRDVSIFEWLRGRAGGAAAWWGAFLFTLLTLTWMAFMLLMLGRVLAAATDVPFAVIVPVLGAVTIVYTLMGGMRALVGTDVLQAFLMFLGIALTLGSVAFRTQSSPLDWYDSTQSYLVTRFGDRPTTWYSFDPFTRTSVMNVALSLFTWKLVIHAGNPVMVQRYHSCPDLKTARRGFYAGLLAYLVIVALLALVGMAMVHYLTKNEAGFGPDPWTLSRGQADMVFPLFMRHALDPISCGLLLAALVSAAMSTLDAAFHTFATVLVPQLRIRGDSEQVRAARWMIVLFGALTVGTAWLLEPLTREGNLMELMPTTFNLFVVPSAGMFLVAMVFPRMDAWRLILVSVVGFAFGFVVAHGHRFDFWPKPMSFTLVLPGSLAVMFLGAAALRPFSIR